MDGLDTGRRWRNFKQRLGFKGIGCCGAMWSPTTSTITITAEDQEPLSRATQVPPSGMNLRTALAAERNSRATNLGPTSAKLKSLMRLLEEMDGEDLNKKKKKRREGGEDDWVCCVCKQRNKGAAFIPCGHTFCRVCSTEVWANRGSCPVCNRSILQVLDIF